ncbi:MAG: hypothetical protein KGQ60_09175 [Planctomycetes bacterium]|nr:hypothetical protein [Planctomycetota bacterium]
MPDPTHPTGSWMPSQKEFQTEIDGLVTPPKAFAYHGWQLEPIREKAARRFPTWIWKIQRDS